MAALILLKPCPFCGGQAEFRRWANPGCIWYVACNDCGVETDGLRCKVAKSDSQNKTIQADLWNRRVGGD